MRAAATEYPAPSLAASSGCPTARGRRWRSVIRDQWLWMGDSAEGTRTCAQACRTEVVFHLCHELFQSLHDLGMLRGDIGRFANIGLQVEQGAVG